MTRSSEKISFSGKNTLILFSSLFSLFLILLIAACSKPAGLVGVIVQPEDSKLQVGYTDTITINAYSQKEDSVRTDELTTSQIGSNMDRTFGQTVAGAYVEFMLEEADHDFGPGAQVDSLFLFLLYKDSYGDTNTPLVLRSYMMEERLYVDSAYYSNLDIKTGSIDFSNHMFVPEPNTNLVLGNDTLPPMLKVDMLNNPGLAEKLLNAPDSAMADNETFKNYFNGLYLVTDPVYNEGSIISFDVFSNFSEMIMYYHNDDADSLSFDYTITLLNATANKYMHNHSAGDIEFKQQIVDGDTLLGQENLYLQGLGGTATIIKFPFIKEWRKLGNIAINEAKLILSGSETDPVWGAPAQLSMAEIQDDGSFGYLVDQTEEFEVYFGGDYKSSTNSYTFRITRYLQSLISDPDKKDNGLYLITTGASIFPNRFVFNGYNPSGDTTRRLKVELLYTDLD